MPQLPRFVAAAVIVVWRGKERVDTTQLSLEKEERSRWGGREGGTEGGRGKEVRVETSFGVTRCKHIVWQNGAAAAAPTEGTDRLTGAGGRASHLERSADMGFWHI